MAAMTAAQAHAELKDDPPSGYPVPRFVSLGPGDTNCRSGPSRQHPVRFVFKRPGAPVKVIAESIDHWRRIEDSSGDTCWTHQARLTGQTHILTQAETPLFVGPRLDSKVIGRLAPNLLAKIEKRADGWVRVNVGGLRGWTPASAVWGGAL